MILFRILLVIDFIVGLIVAYFFFIGLADGTVSLSNIVLWLVILLILTSIIAGGLRLKSSNRLALANLVLAILAIPAFLFVLYFFVAITSGARWN
jgi:hypothetical protein